MKYRTDSLEGIKKKSSQQDTLLATMTDSERKLWAYLKQLSVKVRAQYILFGYIVDFYCAKSGVVIEVDGSVHERSDMTERDAKKDGVLKKHGLKVYRITNWQVKNDFTHTCAYIKRIIMTNKGINTTKLKGSKKRNGTIAFNQDTKDAIAQLL